MINFARIDMKIPNSGILILADRYYKGTNIPSCGWEVRTLQKIISESEDCNPARIAVTNINLEKIGEAIVRQKTITLSQDRLRFTSQRFFEEKDIEAIENFEIGSKWHKVAISIKVGLLVKKKFCAFRGMQFSFEKHISPDKKEAILYVKMHNPPVTASNHDIDALLNTIKNKLTFLIYEDQNTEYK